MNYRAEVELGHSRAFKLCIFPCRRWSYLYNWDDILCSASLPSKFWLW